MRANICKNERAFRFSRSPGCPTNIKEALSISQITLGISPKFGPHGPVRGDRRFFSGEYVAVRVHETGKQPPHQTLGRGEKLSLPKV